MFTQKTLVIACSNSDTSINRHLATKISELGQFPLYDLNKIELPILSKQIIDQNLPEVLINFYNFIRKFEKLIFVAPEHNGYFSAFMKNILDFLSRMGKTYFQDQKLFLVVASPGKTGGKSLREFAKTTLLFTGAKFIKDFGFGGYGFEIDAKEQIQSLIQEVNNS